jgi:predicted site-specific integrase-resolvase
MKLSQYAKLKGVSYRTAWNWFKNDKIPNAEQIHSGTIVVNSNIIIPTQNNVVIYARVSSYQQKEDLIRQIERLNAFAAANGFIVEKVIKEIASGMNDNRTILNKILLNPNFSTILVENKDGLTRFGFNYIQNLLSIQDRKIIVINESKSTDDDLLKDLISIITSFCCRIYGIRRGINKSKNIKIELNENTCI